MGHSDGNEGILIHPFGDFVNALKSYHTNGTWFHIFGLTICRGLLYRGLPACGTSHTARVMKFEERITVYAMPCFGFVGDEPLSEGLATMRDIRADVKRTIVEHEQPKFLCSISTRVRIPSRRPTSSGNVTKETKTMQPPFSWWTTVGTSRGMSSLCLETTRRAKPHCSIAWSGPKFSEGDEGMEFQGGPTEGTIYERGYKPSRWSNTT